MSEPVLASDLELSKENVLPLRRGRNPATMLAATADPTNDRDRQRQRQIENFEADISAYEGPDPLANWLEYIKWTEENFPSGGERSCLLLLLERCCMQFKDSEQYRDNKRYLKVWITYAHNCPEPQGLFAFLRKQGIGQKHALFYQAWSYVMESASDLEMAEQILENGLDAGAKPIEKLKLSLDQLKLRRANAPAPSVPGETRSRDALLQLTKKSASKSHRRGRAPKSLPRSTASSKTTSSNANFEVFVDGDNDVEGSAPRVLPAENFSGSRRNKENSQRPGKWNAPLKQRPTPRSPPPAFQVYEEEGIDATAAAITRAPAAGREMNLRRRVHDAASESIQRDPLRNAYRRVAGPDDCIRAYDVDALLDEGTGDPEGLSFEELRARTFPPPLFADDEDDDAMCMTVNHSNILSKRGRSPVTPKGSRPTLQFETPKDEVDSIQTFLDDNRGEVTVISRDLLPPPSPTVTMTMNTRAAMQDVNAMFNDGDSGSENFVYDDEEAEEKNEDTRDTPPQLNAETPAFEIYEDKDVGPPQKHVDAFEIYEDEEDSPPEKAAEANAIHSTEEELDVPKETSDVPRQHERCDSFAALSETSTTSSVNPLAEAERLRLLQAETTKPAFWKDAVDHRSVTAPDEVNDIQEYGSLDLDHLDLLVLTRRSANVFEAENQSEDDDAAGTLLVEIVRPFSLWVSYIASVVRQRLPLEETDNVVLPSSSYHFQDCSLFVTDVREDTVGSLRSLLDLHKLEEDKLPELVAMSLTKELLAVVDALHGVDVLHCAIEPNNILLRNGINNLSLAGFSSAVDLRKYAANVRFSAADDDNQAIRFLGDELRRSWRFEIDSYGAAATIYELVLGRAPPEPLNIDTVLAEIPESYCRDVWEPVFQALLARLDGAETSYEGLRNLIQLHFEDRSLENSVRLLLINENVLLGQ